MIPELALTAAALAGTVVALVLTLHDFASTVDRGSMSSIVQAAAAMALLCGLAWGSVVYLLARWGSLRRHDRFQAPSGSDLEAVYDTDDAPCVCVLVPSYKEEVRVLRQTIVSAALAEYPSRRIVVLIDDPCSGPGVDTLALAAAAQLVHDLDERFRRAAACLRAESAAFARRSSSGRDVDLAAEAARLAHLYGRVASWVAELAEASPEPGFVHVDRFFNDHIVGDAAAAHRSRALRLASSPVDHPAQILREYRRLARLLDVDISCFERKRFANLSHAPNKAMNLNSYIGLLGKAWRIAPLPHGAELLPCAPAQADLVVPRADYLLTLDADSLVRRDYLLKLADVMRRDDRIAVAQTPYSAYPGTPNLLERCAGAQTDIQYVVHQGLSHFHAAYWVGANALLRVRALQDIRRDVVERGHRVPVYIQDKTVIEDTQSTLDLVLRRWTLHNHPERLSYSATPPDFGALIIQRRRWANGGLIILADLVRYALRRGPGRPGATQLLLRAHYLCSPAVSSLAVVLLALLPLKAALSSAWLPFLAVPYLLLYGRDLRGQGYGWTDLWRIYALNLMLVPVNLAGVGQSLRQIVTGRKAAFGRTPKVGSRTSMPPVHVGLQLGMLGSVLSLSVVLAVMGRHGLAAFCAVNAACLLYGLVRFVGLRHAWHDLGGGRRHLAPAPPAGAAAGRRPDVEAGASLQATR